MPAKPTRNSYSKRRTVFNRRTVKASPYYSDLPGLFQHLSLPCTSHLRPGEIIVDLFAGGGGASEALRQALGRDPDIAINHDADAIGMHAANHPFTTHHREDVWQADPIRESAGRPVGWLHASPDCTHFSQAKGGQPRSRATRSLSWVILKWAGTLARAGLAPRIISLENVRQIKTWSRLIAKRDPEMRQQLIDAVAMTPYARAEFDEAWEPTTDQIELARRLAVRAQMGFGSAGATKGTTGFRIDVRRKYGTAQNLWTRFSENIAFAGQRFQEVLIENRPAIDVMLQHDGPETLHFVDPPYMHATRVMGPGKARGYSHEMTDADHVRLLDCPRQLTGMAIVCGYMTDLYRDHLAGWTLRTTQARISGGRGTAMRQECIWINPACMDALSQLPLPLSGGGSAP